MKNDLHDDLLDAEISETPRVPLRGATSPIAAIAPIVVIAIGASLSACDAGVYDHPDTTVFDGGIYAEDAGPTTDDAGIADAGPTVVDAGIYAPDAGDDEGP